MRKLIENLEFIWSWLEEVNPDQSLYNFRQYNPGLHRQKIANLTEDLPISLPEDAYVLYSWKNGINVDENSYLNDYFLFVDHLGGDVPLEFYSLQEAIRSYKRLLSTSLDINPELDIWNKDWFPIAGFESEEYLYIDCSISTFPVIQRHMERSPGIERVYKNLNAMIAVISECCEMNVYHIVPDNYGSENAVAIIVDETKRDLENKIFQKHNS